MTESAKADSLFVGLMSGTSADGIDAAVCRFAPRPTVVAALTYPWPDVLRTRILRVAQGEMRADPDVIGHLDTELGLSFAAAVDAVLEKAGADAHHVCAIGSHGQTIRHRPDGPHAFTLQLGNPWLVAEQCGIDVVADFRRADMAAGGQGAPLMPAFHAALLARPDRTRAILNLGGIANLTILGADGSVRGFDTGPANALLDAWCHRTCGQPFDRDGTLATQGTVDPPLLQQLLADPYFTLPPPKSTGREHFHLGWLDAHPRAATLAAADVQATLLALTTHSIRAALDRYAPDAHELVVCGGGVHNGALMDALGACLTPRTVTDTTTFGVDPDFIEAVGFAWLARQRILQLPGNLPAVTGAHGPRLLGCICRAPANA